MVASLRVPVSLKRVAMKTYIWLSKGKLDFINSHPEVTSLLYDLGLLPEEISARVRNYVEEELKESKLQLKGMTGERDGEREIAVGWEKKCELLELQVSALKETLKDALSSLKDWGSYAPDWAKEKHDFASDVRQLEVASCDHLFKEYRCEKCHCTKGPVGDVGSVSRKKEDV